MMSVAQKARESKARRIQELLQQLYPDPPSPLLHDGPFQLLVAVALSAQTTDARVNLVTPGLFAKASSPAEMVALGPQRILAEIRTCGLAPTKAVNLHRLSQLLLDRHGGMVPASFEALEALPGVGHKTAGVVMAQAFGFPAFPVDTHVHRLAGRWGLSKGLTVVRTEQDLKLLFAETAWSTLHLQMIFFGREHCPARGHAASRCPICSWAASRTRRLPRDEEGG